MRQKWEQALETIYEIYTDGAASKNGQVGAVGGWAFILLENGKPIYHDCGFIENATNNICELTAIYKGCEYVIGLGIAAARVIVYSDSAYCINCYKDKWYKKWQLNGWRNSKNEPVANRDLWKILIPYFESENFEFQKVKGHSNNEYNNRADELAVEARLRGNNG